MVFSRAFACILEVGCRNNLMFTSIEPCTKLLEAYMEVRRVEYCHDVLGMLCHELLPAVALDLAMFQFWRFLFNFV